MLRRHWLLGFDSFYWWISGKGWIRSAKSAEFNHVPATDLEIDEAISFDNDVKPTADPASEIKSTKINRMIKTIGLQAYIKVEPVFNKAITVGRKIGLLSSPGAVGKYIEILRLGRKSLAVQARGVIARSYNKFVSGYKAIALKADTSGGVATKYLNNGKEAGAVSGEGIFVNIDNSIDDGSSAKIVYWIDPVVEDGILYIRQAFSASRNGSELEVQ